MNQAVKAHRAGNTNAALREYQLSIKADPGYFDAQYNAALLALQSGDLDRSLAGWEMALALEPDSLNARYNFALALKQANYPHDAASELEKMLEAKPNDSRAHLTLANLYAQQLNERDKARIHYMKLLELEPRNPQAPSIRFWLAANP
jgi:tetratricopeptide (TPR) repeat protein